jgi:uncharacterized protein
MNQPAAKEPTMDEILSSIRQIIADDDEGAAQKVPAAAKADAEVAAPQPAPVIDPFSDDDEDEVPTLALSPEQIVDQPDAEPEPESEPDEMEALLAEMPSAASVNAAAEIMMPDDVAFAQDEDAPPVATFKAAPKAAASFAKAAPMPDPDLSADLTEELLEPATSAAVASTFAKLNAPRLSPQTPLTAGGVTVEAMIREMMRPMLKEWLEENLPSMVERIVAQEIERVSRGG